MKRELRVGVLKRAGDVVLWRLQGKTTAQNAKNSTSCWGAFVKNVSLCLYAPPPAIDTDQERTVDSR